MSGIYMETQDVHLNQLHVFSDAQLIGGWKGLVPFMTTWCDCV